MAAFTVLETNTVTVFAGSSGAATKSYGFVGFGLSFLDFQVLGGFDPGGSEVINLRFRVNTITLGVFQFHRWQDHSVLVPERSMITIPESVLIPATFPANFLVIDAVSGVPGDYFFLGPMIYHYNS